MPDAFFASTKTRKRKRPSTGTSSNSRDFSKKSKTSKGINGGSFNQNSKSGAAKSLSKGKRKAQDEELESDRTDEEGAGDVDDMDLERRQSEDEVQSGDEYEDETPAEKRLRLAQLYLENVKEGLADGEFDAKDVDRDLLNSRLRQDVLENKGRIHLFVADNYNFTSTSQPPSLHTKGHRFSVTSAVASESGQHLFTSGKEGHIIKWDLQTGKKLATFYKQRPPSDPSSSSKSNAKGKGKAKIPFQGDIRGHTDEVLALAVSGDGKVLVSGGRDKRLVVWDVEKDAWEKCFFGPLAHKDAVSAVSFRKGTRQLYSASTDRSVKVYDLSNNVMGYVETLFGHQDQILSLDSLKGETCVSVGGRDKTVRFWKIVEETQLVFRGGGRSRIREVLEGGLRGDGEDDEMEEKSKQASSTTKKFVEGSVESVAMIDESTFLSGGDSGSICLWSTQKKKPIFTQPLAHGFNEVHSATEGLIQTPRWITALASLRYSDVFASGSWSGEINIWKLDSSVKSFSLIGSIAAPGVVNSLQVFFPPPDFRHVCTWMPPSSSSAATSSQTSHPSLNGTEAPNGTAPDGEAANSGKSGSKKGVKTILLVAGLGQEHKFGRWLSVKEGGAVNGTIVVGFNPIS